jgi:dolichol-phosphate mannosyltransferase
MTEFSSTSIIIPTLNEETNIGPLIKRLRMLYPGVKIIVADDGSKDRTCAIAAKLGANIVNRFNRQVKGISASIVEAFNSVKTPNVIVIDADFQHPPEAVGAIIQKLNTYDLVIAVRKRIVGNWGLFRRFVSKFAILTAQIRLQQAVRDPMSGFFGIRTKIFKSLPKSNFELRCFKILFNILKNVDFRVVKIDYVPYDFAVRSRGDSKIRVKHVIYFLRSVFKQS